MKKMMRVVLVVALALFLSTGCSMLNPRGNDLQAKIDSAKVMVTVEAVETVDPRNPGHPLSTSIILKDYHGHLADVVKVNGRLVFVNCGEGLVYVDENLCNAGSGELKRISARGGRNIIAAKDGIGRVEVTVERNPHGLSANRDEFTEVYRQVYTF